MTFTQPLFTAGGAEIVTSIRFGVDADFALHASNYWTVTVRVRRVGQLDGELVGTYSTQERNLVAGPAVALYPDRSAAPRTLSMKPGDSLWATRVSTGSPAALDAPRYEVDLQGSPR